MKVRKCTLSAHRKKFFTEQSCLDFLVNQKWSAGYICKKCGHDKYIKGRRQLDRRCSKCAHNESPTSGTLYHSMKLPLVLAFEIIYRVAVSKKGMSAIAIAREYGVNPKTATLLRQKMQSGMASSETNPILGEVHVDEFLVGGQEPGKQGRSGTSKKKKATIAVEILPNKKGIGRIYAMHIENFSAKELRKIFDKHLTAETMVVADEWVGYKPLQEAYPNLVQKKSLMGKNFPELHTMILNLKTWLKGIHHNVSFARFQDYLNEFTWRFNRRGFIETININMLKKMCNSKPLVTVIQANASPKLA
jgi:transposase-like protein